VEEAAEPTYEPWQPFPFGWPDLVVPDDAGHRDGSDVTWVAQVEVAS